MKTTIKRDQVVGVFLIVIGLIAGYLNSQLSIDMTFEYPGPKLFPYIGIFGLIVCGAGMFVESTKTKKPQDPFILKEGWIKLGKTFLVLVFYLVGLKYVGYLIATPFVLLILSTMFARDKSSKLSSRIIFSILATILVYIPYIYVFSMQLPKGEIFM